MRRSPHQLAAHFGPGRASTYLRWLTIIVAAVAIWIGADWFATLDPFWARRSSLWIIYGLLALSLALVWGKGGILSVSQAAFFGLGGYAYAIWALNFQENTQETLSGLLVAVVIGAASAAVLGYFMFYGRIGDVYITVITLAFTLAIGALIGSTGGSGLEIGDVRVGGHNGITGIPELTFRLPGMEAHILTVNELLGVLAITVLLVTLGCARMMRTPFGRSVTAQRVNPERTDLLGYDIRAVQCRLFILGGAIAGLAGGAYAAWTASVSPALFGLQQAIIVVIWVLVGGRVSFVGALVGVITVEALTLQLGASAQGLTPIVLGGVLIVVVTVLPLGLAGAGVALFKKFTRRELGAEEGATEASSTSAALGAWLSRPSADLEIQHVSKRFGGLQATDDVTLSFERNSVHCLIGPNGAGKSTLFKLLTGTESPDEGVIRLDGVDVTRLQPHQRARLGIGIKKQIASIYPELSVSENLWLAANRGSHGDVEVSSVVDSVGAWLGLADRMDAPAAELPHGTKQWLEIAMVLVSSPRVILLDEPAGGMTHSDVMRTAALAREIGQFSTVIVVEHAMDFVHAVDSPTTVLHRGAVFTSGTMNEIRSDARVQDIYLGREDA